MEEYFKKWCCLILYAKDEESWNIYNEGRIRLREEIQCHTRFYQSEKLRHLNGPENADDVLAGEMPDIGKLFQKAFSSGYRKVLMPLNGRMPSSEILKEGFSALKMIDLCLGPASSGNIYLFGMNCFEPEIFAALNLNNHVLYRDALKVIGNLKLPVYKLPVLNDTAFEL